MRVFQIPRPVLSLEPVETKPVHKTNTSFDFCPVSHLLIDHDGD